MTEIAWCGRERQHQWPSNLNSQHGYPSETATTTPFSEPLIDVWSQTPEDLKIGADVCRHRAPASASAPATAPERLPSPGPVGLEVRRHQASSLKPVSRNYRQDHNILSSGSQDSSRWATESCACTSHSASSGSTSYRAAALRDDTPSRYYQKAAFKAEEESVSEPGPESMAQFRFRTMEAALKETPSKAAIVAVVQARRRPHLKKNYSQRQRQTQEEPCGSHPPFQSPTFGVF